jgi:hypothetical protein
MSTPPKLVVLSEKIYRKLLLLYPPAHRRDYGGLMAQLFRDQCRDAYREGRTAGLMKLWLRVLPDIGRTSIQEQIAAIERKKIMKNITVINNPTTLLIIGIALGILSVPFVQSPGGLLLAIASALAILARAIVDLFRPSIEWKRIVLATLVIMVIYGLLMPAWAKRVVPGDQSPVLKLTFLVCLFANPAVALVKSLQFLIERRKV